MTVKTLKETAKKVVKVVKEGLSTSQKDMFNYETKESREATILFLFDYAKRSKADHDAKCIKYDDYYNGRHETALQIAKSCQAAGIPWIPAEVSDAYIHVESLINPDCPDFEFSGRDGYIDPRKAKQREYVVKYVCDSNKLERMIPNQERRINKSGDCVYKVYWDSVKRSPYTVQEGDISIYDIDPANIFPDPTALCVDDCEYIDYVYPLHKREAARRYKKDLKKLGKTIHEFGGCTFHTDTQIYTGQFNDFNGDTVQIIEHWYRDDDGDIALSILINLEEVRHVPKYWMKTGAQNKLYPFVKICKISAENSFWGRSELESIINYIDAADREMAYGMVNDAFMSNDIILSEAGAFVDDKMPESAPGAHWQVNPGKIGAVARLKGLESLPEHAGTVEFLQKQIERTVGNYDTSMGQEPARVSTASGIAQLNERADSRKNIKKADRTIGYENLFELIDWTALEFYDDNRLIYLGVPGSKRAEPAGAMSEPLRDSAGDPYNDNLDAGPIIFKFNSESMKIKNSETQEAYFPRVDATIHAGDSLAHNKAFTLSFLEGMLAMPITPLNFKIVESMVELVDLPMRKEIIDHLDKMFASGAMNPATSKGDQGGAAMPAGELPEETPPSSGLPPEIRDILSGLTQEQIQQISENPQMLEQLMQGGGQQTEIPPEVLAILEALTPEQQALVMQNPQLLEEIMQGGAPSGEMQGQT
jgi:hypothetical protein